MCKEDHKHQDTHKQGRALHVLSEINISFALLVCLDADWQAFLRGTAQGHTHTHTLSHAPDTHTVKLLRAVVCFDWRIGRAELTPRWHSIPFRRTSLFTNYSKQNATFESLCGERVSSLLPVYYDYMITRFPHFTFTSLNTQLIKAKLCVPSCLCLLKCACSCSIHEVSLVWAFFFTPLFAVLLRVDQERSVVIVTQWIGTVFKCKFTALQWQIGRAGKGRDRLR